MSKPNELDGPARDAVSAVPDVDEDITIKEVLYWGEFCSWTALALSPFLYWVNGPAVSTDQFVMRTGLVCLAAVTAIGLRVYKTFWPQDNGI